MNRFVLICMLLLGISAAALAQETVEVTGVVTDVKREPLIGVSISVLDAPGLGTTTDINGRYKIKMERYKKLKFSYIGFDSQEILVKDAFVINVTLKESESSVLNEVVITGTGVQKKASLTAAVTTVNVADLKSNPTSSISNALAGNVPGVMAMMQSGQPGKNISEFWIRGISTFGGGSSALVLVDNIERSIDEINIEDIESFSVLKDAAVTAIYGSRGANGVILITTKRGKQGKISINFKDENIYNTRTVTPEFEDGATYASLINEAQITRNKPAVFKPEELEIFRLGLDPDLYPNVNWKDLLLRDGAMTYRANLNLNGGGSTARYFLSGSYVSEGGMYNIDETLKDDYNTNANYRRWNYRLNTDIDITKTTVAKVGIAGSLGKRNSPGLGDNDFWGSLFGYSPIGTPVTYSNGRVPAYGSGPALTNPWVLATQTGFNENWANKIQTDITLEQNFDFITKGLRFRGIIGFDTNNDNTIFRRKYPEQWRADARDGQGNLVWQHISDPREMFQESAAGGERREFVDLMFNYDRGFGDHNFGAVAKFTRDALVRTVNLGDDIKNGVSRRNLALSGRTSYNWKSRYFADFTFGYTGSENFAPGEQFGFFPAVSFAWNISEEPFIKDNLPWMNLFKIRYSHGKAGNDQLNGTRFPYLYTTGEAPDDGYRWADYGIERNYTGMRYTQVASPYVTWEVAVKKNLGFDLSLFRDKIGANLDFFDEKRTGIYMRREYLPAIVGLESTPSANVGEVKSRGFDGRFEYKERAGEFNITARGNVTYSKNEILERDEPNNVYSYQNQSGYRVDQSRGLIALGMFKDYDEIRNSPTQMFGTYQPGDLKYKDVNGDGVIDDGDRVAIGATRRPNLIYGLGTSVSWKGLDVNVHFQGAGKSTFSTYGKTVFAFSEGEWGQVMKGVMGDNRWISADISGDPSTEDPNASYPRLSFGGNANNFRESTFWLRDGRYLRLKTVDIGYTIPKRIANRIKTNTIRIFVVGSNLVTWSKFKLWDPELASPRGEDYPLPKSITLGLNVNL
ncbi:TonB-linked SusC/RagA family outer membrane protein [Arcticibacter tournemirensis]|uniref:TonB-dependent receptor n=1 Tax=Arcticibacter tournemirensis TaxID=699437 RepID=A0A5M9HJJ7_9SPHI|nr:TonB-dependent receptor [Arcticibacter tournemirensis]KAA8485548.1 TonB-dependent receptor [Arcticibacter tournemirensis]TQM48739.1 TonB-linked SusC/RagA family outer membrane protein [Arcticibacter tournemirensis]